VENLEKVQRAPRSDACYRTKAVVARVFLTIECQAAYRHGRVAELLRFDARKHRRISPDGCAPDSAKKVPRNRARNERPVRGDNRTGQAIWGAWGGWALAPNTASMGRDYRSHLYLSRKGRRTFKPDAIFFNRQQVPERFQAGACPPGSRNGNRFAPEKPVKSAFWRPVLTFWTRQRKRPRLELTARRNGWPRPACRRP